jgi:hypothetical protein
MKAPMAGRSFLFEVAMASVAVICFFCVPDAKAATIDFDSLNTGQGPVTGTTLTNYLDSFGITVSGASPGLTLGASYDGDLGYHCGSVQASSGHNFLRENSSTLISTYILDFSQALTGLSFTRISRLSSASGGTAYPYWRATVFEGDTQIDSVAEDGGTTWAYWDPAKTFTFTGTGITSIRMDIDFSNTGAYGEAGNVNAIMIDDIVMTPTPEPATLSLLALGGLAVTARRGRARA